MSDIRAVLLVPADHDPLELLAEGPCGARPPMAWRTADLRHEEYVDYRHGPECHDECVTGPQCRIVKMCGGCGAPFPCPEAGQVAEPGRWVAATGTEEDGPWVALALVLAWDGKPVAEGLDRWWRVGMRAGGHWPYRHPIEWDRHIDEITWLDARDLGRLVFLGADGREVTT